MKTKIFVWDHFSEKMCDLRDNPCWALSHVEDILNIVEEHGDVDHMNRILRGWEYYLLPPDNEYPVLVEKRNRVIEVFVEFVTLMREREETKVHVDNSDWYFKKTCVFVVWIFAVVFHFDLNDDWRWISRNGNHVPKTSMSSSSL